MDTQGKLSATLRTTDNKVNITYNNLEAFAIGSTFKIYVLGALAQSIARGEHQWNENLAINEDWKSLPSGKMQDLPPGKEFPLYEYAEKMISISDNTAADHLINLLGREQVENMLVPMGNIHEQNYLPFLTTIEIFKLKWALNPLETQNYIQMNKSERAQFLKKIPQISKDQIGNNGIDFDKPTLVDKLEWFATTPENCNAVFWLANQNSIEINKILSKSVPILNDVGAENSHWQYAGYKGGSEPGVLTMTFLLESKNGNRACFAISWNNQKENVAQGRFMDIVRKTLKFAETLVP